MAKTRDENIKMFIRENMEKLKELGEILPENKKRYNFRITKKQNINFFMNKEEWLKIYPPKAKNPTADIKKSSGHFRFQFHDNSLLFRFPTDFLKNEIAKVAKFLGPENIDEEKGIYFLCNNENKSEISAIFNVIFSIYKKHCGA